MGIRQRLRYSPYIVSLIWPLSFSSPHKSGASLPPSIPLSSSILTRWRDDIARSRSLLHYRVTDTLLYLARSPHWWAVSCVFWPSPLQVLRRWRDIRQGPDFELSCPRDTLQVQLALIPLLSPL